MSGVTYTVTAKATATANVSSYYLGIDMYSYYHTSTGKVCRYNTPYSGQSTTPTSNYQYKPTMQGKADNCVGVDKEWASAYYRNGAAGTKVSFASAYSEEI